jgi:molybdopterin-containing oxidoreductase family iron-sulfur binding subunit
VDEGTADGVIAIAVGWGRATGLARNVGKNAFSLVSSTVIKTGRTEELARTQTEFRLDARERDVVRIRSRRDAPFAEPRRPHLSLYPMTTPTASHAWAMTIDLGKCTGCNACVVACQAENNVPTVGKRAVLANRVMHWLRIDRYDTRNGAVMQPMLCQHCDSAPCEYVCPVNATVHSPDGLNEMVYNRCVGTRFCSNNCPYKVRRFNWFNAHEDEAPIAQLAHNPNVTVRARGVMEKCTFCVQRIREAEHRALVEHRELVRDEVVTACAEACPTRAIVFGDAKDEGSTVSASLKTPEAYAVLDDLGTRPRVRYFPKIVDDEGPLG